MDELERRKLEAEIANIEAQANKARADAAKVEADSKASHRSWRDWSLEAVKVVGAIALGLGGVTAAITGYQISEVRKERLDLAAIKTKAELDELNSQKASTDAAVSMAQLQLADMKKQVEGLQVSLETAKKSGATGQLDQAISQAAGIVKAVARTNEQLNSVDQSAPRARQISDYLVGLQTLGVTESVRNDLNESIGKKGYQLDSLSASYDARPSWFAQQSTVFYYSRSALSAAQNLAAEMKNLTGDNFAVQRGSGLGVDPGKQDVTLFVHYIKK